PVRSLLVCLFCQRRRPPTSPLFPYTTLFRSGGGGTAWDGLAYDPEARLLYVGTGNGGPWNRDLRSPDGGDNLYLVSIHVEREDGDRKSTRLNSSHVKISYAVFCLQKKKK